MSLQTKQPPQDTDVFYVEIPQRDDVGEKVSIETTQIEATADIVEMLADYHQKFPIKLIQPKEIYPFRGLWLTDRGFFVNVVSKHESYVIGENGRKVAICLVDEDGKTEHVGKIMERRRGEEVTTLKGQKWPKLRSE